MSSDDPLPSKNIETMITDYCSFLLAVVALVAYLHHVGLRSGLFDYFHLGKITSANKVEIMVSSFHFGIIAPR